MSQHITHTQRGQRGHYALAFAWPGKSICSGDKLTTTKGVWGLASRSMNGVKLLNGTKLYFA